VAIGPVQLVVHKDAEGEIEVVHLSNLFKDEAIELGSKVGALVGLGIEGEDGLYAGADAAADGISAFRRHPHALPRPALNAVLSHQSRGPAQAALPRSSTLRSCRP
jgi:hypothetical protein